MALQECTLNLDRTLRELRPLVFSASLVGGDEGSVFARRAGAADGSRQGAAPQSGGLHPRALCGKAGA